MPKGMKNMRTLLLMIFAALSLSVSAQTITLNGNVKDTTGEPIIGASIVEKGNTTNGTITDLDGNFSLKVPARRFPPAVQPLRKPALRTRVPHRRHLQA